MTRDGTLYVYIYASGTFRHFDTRRTCLMYYGAQKTIQIGFYLKCYRKANFNFDLLSVYFAIDQFKLVCMYFM